MLRLDPRVEEALSKRSTLFRWLEFVGGSEFTALSRLLHGMKLLELINVPVSGLAKLGMVPSTARRLSDELQRLRAVLNGGVRAPPWLMPLLEPERAAERALLDANPLTLGPPPTAGGPPGGGGALDRKQGSVPTPPSQQQRPGGGGAQ